MVYRTDLVELDPTTATTTTEGYLRVPGYAGRTGVLLYRNADGTTRRELVRPDVLRDPTSLATLKGKPYTRNHPQAADGAPILVNPSNYSKYTAGHVCDDVIYQGDDQGGRVRVTVQIMRKDAIEAARAGERQLSQGYQCDLREEPGTWNGEAYDAIQLNRRYNHLAQVVAGRAGPECALKFDSSQLNESQTPTREEPVALTKISFDGQEFQVEDASSSPLLRLLTQYKGDAMTAAEMKKTMDEMKTKMADMKPGAEYDAMEQKYKKLQEDMAALKGKADAMEQDLNRYRSQEEAQRRDGLVQVATSILGTTFKADGLDSTAIKEAIVKAKYPTLTLDSKQAGYAQYLEGLFLGATNGTGIQTKTDHLQALGTQIHQTFLQPPASVDKFRADSMKQEEEAWKTKLS